MQDYPGAPGTARPGNPGTAVPAACGGAAVLPLPPAPDRHRSCATPLPMSWGHIRPHAASLPTAPAHNRSGATSLPQSSGHVRPYAASMASPGHADVGCGPVRAGRSVPLTTAPVPAPASRLLRIVLLRVTATPHTRIYRHFRFIASSFPRKRESRHAAHQVHPAVQLSTRPPPATASAGLSRQHNSRAPPLAVRRKPTLVREAAYRSRSRYASAGRSAGARRCHAMGSTISSDTPAAAQYTGPAPAAAYNGV